MYKTLIAGAGCDASGVLLEYLNNAGLSSEKEPDAEAAAARALFVDCVVTSADSEGFDICQKIKTAAEYIPVLLTAESGWAGLEELMAQSGADDWVVSDNLLVASRIKALCRVKKMSDELKSRYKLLEDRTKRLDFQMAMAKRVQRSFIREFDMTVGDVRFVSKYLPALEIGGDFFEIAELDEDTVAVCIGDVSGHGISAALLTVQLNCAIRAAKYYNPAQFLYHMNNEMVKVFEGADIGMYACVFAAVINTRRKRVYYANAGQVLPIRYCGATGQISELMSIGTPIGLMPNESYDYRTLAYEPGDIILFYTDGMSDNAHKDDPGEFFARAEALLAGMANEPDPNVIAGAVVDEFCAYPDGRTRCTLDDVSLIVARF